MLESFTRETLAPHLGETFRLHLDGATVLDLELVEATDLSQGGGAEARGPGAPPARAPFSLVFRGSREALLPQRIYHLEHDRIGAFDLFLVPIGPDAVGMRYEAVFT
jgi:hypothetical protein